MTVTVTAYDGGVIKVDSRPIDRSYEGWLGADLVRTVKLIELRRQAEAGQRAAQP
jgi:hypothetical protein